MRRLRHPVRTIALVVVGCVLLVAAVIVGVGVHKVMIRDANNARCAINGHGYGPSGGRFVAAFPSSDVSSSGGSGSRWLWVGVTVDQFGLMGAAASRFRVHKWTSGHGVTLIKIGKANGAFTAGCTPNENICHGLLEVANPETEWFLSLEGTGSTLPAIKAFFRSFRPVTSS